MSGIVGQNLGRGSGLVKKTAVAADSVTGSEIADDAIDSEHYTDASIDNAHLADNAADTAEIADNAVTLAKMAGLARGKLIYGDASGDPAALTAGSADEVLTHDGTDFDWAAAAGGGKILQVVSYDGNINRVSSASATYVATGTSIAITPAASTSKILIFMGGTNAHGYGNSRFTLYRDINGGGFSDLSGGEGIYYGNTDSWVPGAGSMLDSPSTTSECTYEVYIKNTSGGTVIWGGNSSVSDDSLPTNGVYLVAFEVGA